MAGSRPREGASAVRGASRVCREMFEDQGNFALPVIAVVLNLFLLLQIFAVCVANGTMVRPGEFLFNLWLMLGLAASYSIWAALRSRRVVGPAGATGFVLAAYGLWARIGLHFLLYSASETYGSTSVTEDTADEHLRFLIALLRYGGLAAFVLGLALAAWGGRPAPSPRKGRGGGSRSGSTPPAGPEERAPRAGAPRS